MEALLVIAVLVFIMFFYFFKKNPRSKESNNIEIKNDGAIRFYVDQANPEEIKHCELGDSVKLWMPSVDPRRITIYREGTYMGAGKIGYVSVARGFLFDDSRVTDTLVDADAC